MGMRYCNFLEGSIWLKNGADKSAKFLSFRSYIHYDVPGYKLKGQCLSFEGRKTFSHKKRLEVRTAKGKPPNKHYKSYIYTARFSFNSLAVLAAVFGIDHQIE